MSPKPGAPLTTDDFDMIMDAVLERKQKHPNEPIKLTLYLVMSGIGERFRKIQCVEQEWACFKHEVPESMTCPNNHSLHEGPGLTLGWIETD
jgi:hypothetical protein